MRVSCVEDTHLATDLEEMQPLDPRILKMAYARGWFPMPDPDTGEINWYQPDPRAIIPLDRFHSSRSLRRSMRKENLRVSIDEDFAGVMQGCASRPETWITPEFETAYKALYESGDAHSVEIWRGNELVGGVYGVSLGGAFFAESKFHKVRDASKMALFHLVEHMRARGMTLLEVQFLTPHLATLGAVLISSEDYMGRLAAALAQDTEF
jgi:leucyl/phenylalanyl-tRNA--protein transferase